MTDDRDFRCDCQCHLPMGFLQPYLSPAPPAMRPCPLCIGGHERIAARWAMERPGPGRYIPHEFEPGTETGQPVECKICRNTEDHVVHLPPFAEDDVCREAEFLDELNHPNYVPPPNYRPPSVEDGTVSEGLISSLRYLIGEYGYAGVMNALEQLKEPEPEKPSVGEAFKRGFDKGWRR